MNLRRFLWSFVGIAMSLGCSIFTSGAQQSPAADAASQEVIGKQAVALILGRYKIDPNNSVPKTGKPLRTDGQWAVGKASPQSCPKTDDPCVRVVYRVPDVDVTCEWTVLLRGNNDSNIVLNLNEDAARYLVVQSADDQVRLKKLSGEIPVYPFIARSTHVRGSVRDAGAHRYDRTRG